MYGSYIDWSVSEDIKYCIPLTKTSYWGGGGGRSHCVKYGLRKHSLGHY